MFLQRESSVLVLLILLGAAPAFGVRVRSALGTGSNSTAGALVPHFDIGLKGVLCGKVDFGALVGLLTNYPETEMAIREKALYFANAENCRLCDVSVTQASIKSPTVTCAASRGYLGFGAGNTDVACLAGNGEKGYHSGYPCIPCPKECGYCEKPGNTDPGYWGGWFKCVFKEERENQNLPAPWDCEAVEDRRKHRGQMAWCKYRKDLLSSSTNGLILQDKTAAWDLKIAAAHCSGVAESDELEGPALGIMKTVGPAIAEQYSRNCELCRITAGGPISSDGVGDFKFVQAHAENIPWAYAKCAYDEIGVAACRTDRGAVGWDAERECAPCPNECASCKVESGFWGGSDDTFSCKLRPTAKAGHQLGRLLTSSHKTPEVDSPPKLPHEDFKCGVPVPRKCTSGEGICMGFKVDCKFLVQVD